MHNLAKHCSRDVASRIRRSLTSPLTVLEPFEAYQVWASSYHRTEDNALIFAEESVVRPMLEAALVRGKSVLDAACGAGRHLRVLSQLGPRFLAGVDFSPRMIDEARKGFHFEQDRSIGIARLEHLPFRSETFDLVLCTLALDHVRELTVALGELARVLRTRGSLVISCFHPDGQRLGWVRSFSVKNALGRTRRYAVRYYAHPKSAYLDALRSMKVEVVQIAEPVIDERLKPFYERAHRLDLYERFYGLPLLLIFRAEKK
jgi:malonyl-CoA O-methyltransferase